MAPTRVWVGLLRGRGVAVDGATSGGARVLSRAGLGLQMLILVWWRLMLPPALRRLLWRLLWLRLIGLAL